MTTFANIQYKNLESQQALLKIQNVLQQYNIDADIQTIIPEIDNIKLAWVIGNTNDCSTINEKIRKLIYFAYLNNDDISKQLDLFDCLLILTHYWPLNAFDEDENSFECPIAMIPIDDAERIVFPTGSQMHRTTLNEYLLDSINRGLKDPVNTIAITSGGLEALIAQHPSVAAEVRDNPRLMDCRNDYIKTDFSLRMKLIVKTALALTIIYIIAPMIITFSPLALLIASIILATYIPVVLLVSRLYSAYKAFSIYTEVNNKLENISQRGTSSIQTFRDAITNIKENTVSVNSQGPVQPDSPSADVAIDVHPELQISTTAALVRLLNLEQTESDAQPDNHAQRNEGRLASIALFERRAKPRVDHIEPEASSALNANP